MSVNRLISNGLPWPLGAHIENNGINFAVFSGHSQAIELCLFDQSGEHQTASFYFAEKTNSVWHIFVPDLGEGTVYGFRAHGIFDPPNGHRFDSTKVLLDPYAKDVFQSKDSSFRAKVVRSDGNHQKNYSYQLPPSHERVIYELHVKGFSKFNHALPESIRGTYAGLAHPVSIKYLKSLGVNALSILPVQYCFDEPRLTQMGLSNYWGYNTLAFFCPNPRYASSGDPRAEFKAMVTSLHNANIEVLLDVVYNHTAESDEHGPLLSFRGLDNAAYYRLPHDDPSKYVNFSGCGNTLDIRRPQVLQLITDSLRYWVTEMGVDGFRFDLAPILGRQAGEHGDRFTTGATFFQTIAQDPVLSRVTLIAEPWDIGGQGYQLGNFPSGWGEWNDQFRDTMRSFWLHDGKPKVSRATFAMRLCGSADIFQNDNRGPADTVNFVAAHDGFTLRDTVSFEQRHNEANGENNRDGHAHNLSINCGVEGDTNRNDVIDLRARLQRVLIATTLLSLGTPMLCAGSEFGHSQKGNNNPYCQDNATTWLDWQSKDESLLEFTSYAIHLGKRLQIFGHRWGAKRLTWLKFDGEPMTNFDWHSQQEHTLACLIEDHDGSSTRLLIVNPEHCSKLLNLSIQRNIPTGPWRPILNTAMLITQHDLVTLQHQPLCINANTLMLLELNLNTETT